MLAAAWSFRVQPEVCVASYHPIEVIFSGVICTEPLCWSIWRYISDEIMARRLLVLHIRHIDKRPVDPLSFLAIAFTENIFFTESERHGMYIICFLSGMP